MAEGCMALSLTTFPSLVIRGGGPGWKPVPRGAPNLLRRVDNFLTMQLHRSRKPKPNLSDAEVREILVQAMADVGADPALVYAFQKTGVYVCDENEKRLPKEFRFKFSDGAVDEYFDALRRPPQ